MHQSNSKLRRFKRVFVAVLGLFSVVVYGADPEPIEHPYSISFPIGRKDVILRSEAECAGLRCQVTYSVTATPIDAFTTVRWNDKQGQPLITASSSWWLGFYAPGLDNSIQATEIRKTGRVPIVVETGTADFTGSFGGGSRPCGTSFICPGATYHALLGVFSETPKFQGVYASTLLDEPLDDFSGSIWRVDIRTAEEAQVINFQSFVYSDPGGYRYRYEVTNTANLAIPFNWSVVGFSGIVDPQETLVLERVSASAPYLAAAQTETVFQVQFGPNPTENVLMSLETLAPVPEASITFLLLAGIAFLGRVGFTSIIQTRSTKLK